MPRFRLRHQSSNLEMPLGEFLIGRSSECHLSIDDASVSRKHAVLTVDVAYVTVRDLGSRNGVRVNGKAIDGEQRLSHLDKIGIGNQEMLFIDADQGGQQKAATVELGRCAACGAVSPRDAEACSVCGARMSDGKTDGQTIDLRIGGASDDVGKAQDAFLVVAGIAEKTLAMGSFEKAEQLLAAHLDTMVFRAQRGETYSQAATERAIGFALRLAEERNPRRWLQWIFILHIAAKRVMDAATIDRLHEVVRKVRYNDSRPLRDYLGFLAGIEDRLSAADRFLVKRLEALQRVIAA